MLAAGGFSLDATAWSQLGAWGQYDPGADLDQLTTPTLAIFSGNDPLVPSRPASRACGEPLIGRCGPSRSPSSPGADHRLQGGTSLVPGYLTCLSTWCREPRLLS